MNYTLGLDLGTNSIGWALVDSEKKEIIDAGVRVFPEGVDKINSEKEASRNQVRRTARQARRQNERRKMRRRQLRSLIKNLGMMPDDPGVFFALNPYELRKKALYEKLSLIELGRVLDHLNSRRGFKSNRKAKKDKEEGKIFDGMPKESRPGINTLREVLQSNKYRTIGEYFASLNPHEIRIRNRFTQREMYVEEFDAIWKKQKQYYPDILDDDLKTRIRDEIIFYQRKLKSQKNNVGRCTFEKSKKRAPWSSPLAQKFRMLQQVNMIRIAGNGRWDEEQQVLTEEERTILIDYLMDHESLKIEKMFKLLGLDQEEYQANFEKSGKIMGMKTYAQLAKVFGRRKLRSFSEDELNQMWHVLHFSDDDEWLESYSKSKWGLDDTKSKKFCQLTLEQGYARLSSRAMRRIVKYLEEGLIYSDACQKAGYQHSISLEKDELLDQLPLLSEIEEGIIVNPVVVVAVNQLRLVVNALIKKYGRPKTIRVELARDLKLPKAVRIRRHKEMRERELYHDSIKKRLREEGIADPSRNDIIKYKLWEECNQVCPYTGRKIGFAQLFNGEVQVEHILPFSRTLDDSYMNKTLCFVDENARKGNKTPYEAYSSDEKLYKEILERARKLPYPKARKFALKSLSSKDSFLNRQLSDTAYISRVALSYLYNVCNDVSATVGNATAMLRRYWGLNSILAKSIDGTILDDPENGRLKNRDDHRHHAVDAIVVALTTRSMLMEISKRHGRGLPIRDFPLPWNDFRAQVLNSIDRIIVSHKVNKRVRGQLHEDTFYGQLKDRSGAPWQEKGKIYYAVRKTLDSLTAKQVHNIIDPVVKQTVICRLREHGVDTDQKRFNIPRDAFKEPLYLVGTKTGKKTRIKRVRIKVPSKAMLNVKKYNVWVEPGNNHHIVIYDHVEIDDSGTEKVIKRTGEVVTLFEAYRRRRCGEPVINRSNCAGRKFVCSLQMNDLVVLDKTNEEVSRLLPGNKSALCENIFRVQKITDGIITFRHHTVAVLDERLEDGTYYTPGRCFRTPSSFKGVKISIDPVGDIRIVND